MCRVVWWCKHFTKFQFWIIMIDFTGLATILNTKWFVTLLRRRRDNPIMTPTWTSGGIRGNVPAHLYHKCMNQIWYVCGDDIGQIFRPEKRDMWKFDICALYVNNGRQTHRQIHSLWRETHIHRQPDGDIHRHTWRDRHTQTDRWRERRVTRFLQPDCSMTSHEPTESNKSSVLH